MAISTSNLYGNIHITRKALRAVAGIAALECYGVWGVGGKRTVRSAQSNFRPRTGVRIWTMGNKIGVYIDLTVCFGMPISTLITSIRKTIKYKVENYSGMAVQFVDIRIMGIRK